MFSSRSPVRDTLDYNDGPQNSWMWPRWWSSALANMPVVSSTFSSFPLVWTLQRLLRLPVVHYYTLSERQLSAEVEHRLTIARNLQRLHRSFLYTLVLFVFLELLRSPTLWLVNAFLDNHTSLLSSGQCTFLFYAVYMLTLLLLAVYAFEIFKLSNIPALHLPLAFLQRYPAGIDLASTAFFRLSLKEQPKDTRESYARQVRQRHILRQDADDRVEREQQSFLDGSFHQHQRSFQRNLSGVFGPRMSPNRTWNDSFHAGGFQRSGNRSFGSGQSSKSSSPGSSIVMAAADWDPLDREEVDKICGQEALAKLLAQEEHLEKSRMSFQNDESMNWSPLAQMAREQNYQSSGLFRIPSPKKNSATPSTPADESTAAQPMQLGEDKVYPVEDYSWIQLKVSAELLLLWTENVRMWLFGSIISPLLTRIDQVNVKLKERTRMDNVVGETAPDQLRQLGQQYRQQIPELMQVIPFLEITIQQDYLLKRLRDLAKDGVLGDYSWNNGAPYGGQMWQDFLPTDAAIIMHCFVTYFDVLLPPDPHAPNWRSFSHRYVLRNLQHWRNEDSQKPMIHQASSNPPKYQILHNGKLLQLADGRNNVFHAILLFVRLMYLREKASKGYANLGAGREIFKLFEISLQ
ncbi:hypothetical protein RvY_17792 [Ramazzottius varieornatus]|uniref:Transmembrane protein 209 n=1 Tax=Ramazzottius varieornatus TaxID=947166 RepID=A0A1D1W948_RAMVA|nr:hypothetical protein RvY_17792 [Ramazzottius varieornatus]